MNRRESLRLGLAAAASLRATGLRIAARTMPGAAAVAAARADDASPIAFALIGDTPYNALEERTLARVLASFDPGVGFAIHVGDLKSGWEPCSDELFAARRAVLGASPVPLVFTPGDNEWLDCARVLAGGRDPLERLERLRDLFHRESPTAAGLPGIESQATPPQGFPENQRWRAGAALFATINLPGSNNGADAGAALAAHNAIRNAAAAAWLRESFAVAAREKLPGIVVAAHANPGFERDRNAITPPGTRSGNRDGYREFRHLLRDLVRSHRLRVLFLHGDTHRFRVDQPLVDANGEALREFTRVECFGSPFSSYWVRVSVDARRESLFAVEFRQV